MNKGWSALSWILIVAAQIATGYFLVLIGRSFYDQRFVKTLLDFLVIPLIIWAGYLTGIYSIGMLGLVLKKVNPKVAGLRFVTTATMAIIPMGILVFNAATIGVENQAQFQSLVIGRMIPYYTQLCAVFTLLGFYITIWWHRVIPPKSTPG